MKIVSLPLVLLAIAGLLLTGCKKDSSTVVLKDSNPDVFLTLTDGSTSTTVTEGATTEVDVRLTFTEALVNPMDISFTIGGSATEGADFLIQSRNITIRPSDTTLNGSVYQSTVAMITLKDDSVANEGIEDVTVTLANVSYGNRALPITVTVSITDDEAVTPKPLAN